MALVFDLKSSSDTKYVVGAFYIEKTPADALLSCIGLLTQKKENELTSWQYTLIEIMLEIYNKIVDNLFAVLGENCATNNCWSSFLDGSFIGGTTPANFI